MVSIQLCVLGLLSCSARAVGTSQEKIIKLMIYFLLDRAVYMRRKYGNKQLSSATYLSEAEPFLEQYAKRSPQNQALIGSAGNLVRAEDFLAIVEEGMDEEGDLQKELEAAPSSPMLSGKDAVPKAEGLIVFFPGYYLANWIGFVFFPML